MIIAVISFYDYFLNMSQYHNELEVKTLVILVNFTESMPFY